MFRNMLLDRKSRPLIAVAAAVVVWATMAVATPATGQAATGAAGEPVPADRVGLSAAAEASAQQAAEQGVTLAPAVLEEVDQQGATDFWVDFDDQADLSRAGEIDEWAERGQYVYDQLVETAKASQAALRFGLTASGIDHESFWISNAVLVRGGDHAVLNQLLARPEVAAIRVDQAIDLPDPVETPTDAAVTAVESGIANIRADQVWSQFGTRGEGIVVGNIDTGVDYTHPALINQYRGNLGGGEFDHDYNWWDPSAICPADEPCDNHNHGTHTMGTMVGDDGAGNQIGVAPGAQWIAAKGCEVDDCSHAALLSSGQFMLAPTNLAGGSPRPDLRPHVVNNSWSGAHGDEFYDNVVAAWVAAGIFPVFSNGNRGPGCGTAGSPADGPDAYAVGAHDSGNEIADFSSRGPGRDGQIRPNLSAPGVRVRSSIAGGDYGRLSGTSMAAPHTAGTVALMWSAAAEIRDIEATREALDTSAVDTGDTSCGGTAEDNNVYGEGRLDALEATIQMAVHSGVIGVVTDRASGQPVPGVSVAVAGRRVLTDEDGRYTVRTFPGSYPVRFEKFGYLTQTVPGVVVSEDTFTTVDVELEPAATGGVAGTVADAVTGHTIPDARVQVLDVPVDFRTVTDADGSFALDGIPAGTYRLEVTTTRPGQWLPADVEVTVTGDATAQVDLAVPRTEGIEPVTTSSDGAYQSERTPLTGRISADGRYVTFMHPARELVDVPVTGRFNAFVYDRHTGVVELIPGSGIQNAGGSAYRPRISDDGRYVAYTGPAGLLEENVPDAPPLPRTWPALEDQDRSYLYDRVTGQVELASVNSHGETVGANHTGPVITPDARYTVFGSDTGHLTDQPLPACLAIFELQLDRCPQIAVHDRVTGQTQVVSVSSSGEMSNTVYDASDTAITPDGTTVAFESNATNLVDGETSGVVDIFVHDLDTGQTELASVLEGSGSIPAFRRPQISADGQVVAYDRTTPFPLPAAVYDRTTKETEFLPQPLDDGIEPFLVASTVARISPDGRNITYISGAVDSSFQPIPGTVGIYVLDRETDAVELLHPLGGEPIFPTVQASPDGRFVLMGEDTGTLMPGDRNGVRDLYVIDTDHEAGAPRPLFAVWDLSVQPERPRPGEPVEVTAKIKNVGDIAGDYEAALLVDSVREPSATRTVTLEPGEVTEVSLPVARQEGGEYRVRIGQAAGVFRVQAGTLAGEITDANDGDPVAAATVTAVSGDITRTTGLVDFAYQLDELPIGTWTVTVEVDDYVAETFEVTIAEDGQQVTRDLALRTGVVVPDRDLIELSVPAGGAQTIELGVANPGTADLAWNAFGWQATVPQEPSVLMYTTSTSTDTHVDQALRRLGLDYTAIRETNDCVGGTPPPFDGLFKELPDALEHGQWDLIIVDQWCHIWALPQPVAEALNTHVSTGGRLIIRSNSFKGPCCRDYPLWETLGVQFIGSPDLGGHFRSEDFPVHWWESDHPIFATPLTVPEFDDGRSRTIGPNRELVRAADGFEGLAGYTLTERPDHAALVLGNGGRTLYNGFWYGDWSTVPGESGAAPDVDADGIPDGVELWTNSIAHVAGLSAQRWLQVERSGTVAPGGDAGLAVTIDATALSPGTYTSSVAVATDAAREPVVTVPVTVTVTACDQTVTGNHAGRLTVHEGVTCLADGASVTGPVRVTDGAGLVAGDATITGQVISDGAELLQLTGSHVTGPVRVRGTTGSVHIADARITGPVRVEDSGTGDSLVVIAGNTITGTLACHGNDPAPVDNGDPNTVTGRTSGQCVALVLPDNLR